jgi:hypothetical protein
MNTPLSIQNLLAGGSSGQYQTLYAQASALRKEYDAETNTELKDALRIVLQHKIAQIQSLWTKQNTTVSNQIDKLSTGL